MGTIEYMDGFDEYTISEMSSLEGWSAPGSSPTMAAGRVEGQAPRTTGTYFQRSVSSDAQYTVGFAWTVESAVISGSVCKLMEGSTVHGDLFYNGNGTFSIRRDTTVLATSANLGITADVWYHLEFDYKVHDSTGEYELKMNEVSVISRATNQDTRNVGTSGVIDVVRLYSLSGVWSKHDDVVITKGGGFQGDCRVVTDYPDADGANTAWAATTSIPTFAAAGTVDAAATSASPAWPSHEVGDIGLLFVECLGEETPVLSVPAGFVEVTNSPQSTGTGTAGTKLAVYWCRATSNTMSTPTVTVGSDHVSGIILTFRGCDTAGDPWDATAGSVKTPTSTSLSASGVTTSVNDCLIVFACAYSADLSANEYSAWANASLGTVTERSDGGTAVGNGGGVGVITGTLATAGGSGTTTATLATTAVNAYLSIALKPPTADYDVVAVNDDDANYISTSSAGDRDTFGFPNLGVTGTVKAVSIRHVTRKDDAGDRKVVTVVRDTSGGGTNYDNATTQTLSTSYAGQQQIYETDPATSSAWTVSNIDAREFGIKLDT